MDIEACRPTVRYAHHLFRSFDYQKFLLAYDYRLFFVCSGELRIIFEDEEHTLKKNSLIIFPPATPYKLFSELTTEFIIMNFDLEENSEYRTTRPPVELQYFVRDNIFSTLTIPPFDKIFVLSDSFSEKERLLEICNEFMSEGKYQKEITSSLMKAVLLKCISKSEREYESEKASPLAKKIKSYIDRLDESENITNGDIARLFSYHENYINNAFRRAFGVSIHSYITKRKIAYAKEILLSTDISISEIAAKCGFSGVSYFSECFRRETGMRPSDFRSTI
jgi:YesN/AraC family two-component response regulator